MDSASEQEFAEYFQARRDVVRRTAYLLCGDWHRADDLAQAAFVALHRRWRQVRDKRALDAYVRRILVRGVVNESRRPWRREHAVAEIADLTMPGGVSGGHADAVTTRHALAAGLALVPPRQRAVLVLRFFTGLDVAATAEALGCSQGTVKSQTARGIEALRLVLGDTVNDLRSAG